MKWSISAFLSIVMLLLLYPGSVSAQIIYALDDIKITPAPATVFHCQTAQAQNCAHPVQGEIAIFQERSGFELPVGIGIDGTAFDVLEGRALTGAALNAGSCVKSYLLVFNPSYAESGSFTATGTVRFGTRVVGFIQGSSSQRSSTFLYQSDSVLGNPNTSYPVFADFGTNPNSTSYGHARGYELAPGTASGQDSIVFLDEYTLKVTMVASYPGDQLRVLTACCACCAT